MSEEQQEKRKIPVWGVVLGVIGGGVVLLACLSVTVIVVLTLLGPAIGETFEEIEEGLEEPDSYLVEPDTARNLDAWVIY